ncbi:histone deacetylase [Moraxella caviae]|uniref:Acetoin utilization protein AcuC n=1 Tax=Moraxella caviae TaxID=34060 RepID=A0A1T0AAP8_9GAMM|nr:histone deacetylase [Moraxella caviae]OOR92802.1 histone deacetylase [Moraxella caviae]STZ14160.1 Acetoin utilization protein AcuC [Moraxella caviae]VEW12606.1 Acetoin utilization protein AcuC [Moraxella caviae]
MLKIAHSPLFCHPVPENHRFPMAKYNLIPEKLLAEGVIDTENLFHPAKLSEQEILSTHTQEYWLKLKTQTLSRTEARKIGFEMSQALVERERYIAHATYECALYAKAHGVSLSTSGGTHHAFADHGEGFCIFNDVCVASNLMLTRNEASRILSVDLDVHQGNGNAAIMANNPNVFIFSMHGAKNYPFIKPPSDLDVELADGTDDEAYLAQLHTHLPAIMERFRPDFMFYQAAVDILASDELGKLAISPAGAKARDEFVLSTAKAHGVPVAVVMGGGYSRNIDSVVEAHCQTFRVAKALFG